MSVSFYSPSSNDLPYLQKKGLIKTSHCEELAGAESAASLRLLKVNLQIRAENTSLLSFSSSLIKAIKDNN